MPDSLIKKIQPFLGNILDPAAGKCRMIAGILGDRPSQSAKSPQLWNAAFRSLKIDATYFPFDVSTSNLPHLLNALRENPQYVGGNVTMPYKVAVMNYLDDIDANARLMNAVNTIGRTTDGKLIGYNTDAQGAVDSLVKTMPWQEHPFLSSLKGQRLLLIGAGGAGSAVAFAMAREIGPTGHITITNRDIRRAKELAGAVYEVYKNAHCITEEEIPSVLSETRLIVNASTRGQSGWRLLPSGRTTCLEFYSSLAPASPTEIDETGYRSQEEMFRSWYKASQQDILGNLLTSSRSILMSPTETAFFDIIYSPLETPFLTQARLSGHDTINGKGMNLAQAVDAFVNRVMFSHLEETNQDLGATYTVVSAAMAEVW